MMHRREILREAWRNLTSGAAHAGWLVLAFVTLVGSLAVADLMAVSSLDLRARNYHEAGASIRVLKAERGIDALRCDVLPSSDGIVSAGALRTVPAVGIDALGGLPTPAFEASRGFQMLLGVDNALEAGVLVPEPLARRWQVQAGDTVSTDQGQMRIAAVFRYPDNDGRDSRLTNAIILPGVGESYFDECWADVWPSTAAFDSLIRTSLVAGSKDSSGMILALNPTMGQYFTGATEYKERVTRFVPFAAAVVGGAIGVLGGARRRLEYASALHAGVRPQDLLQISLTEAACWAGFSWLMTAAICTATARIAMPDIAHAMLGHILVAAGTGALGAVAGSLMGTASSREAKLFKYFKQRT